MALISSHTAVNFLAIDALTFDSHSQPLEIALSLASGKQYRAWIKPWGDIDKLPTQLQRSVVAEGKYPAEICRDLNALCDGLNLHVDHWGVSSFWLETLFGKANIQRRFGCSPIEALLEDDEKLGWNGRKQFVLDVLKSNEHSASSQIEVMQAVINLFYRDKPQVTPFYVEEEQAVLVH